MIIVIYIDNILLVGPNKKEIQGIKDKLSARFEISDLGLYTYYLDMIVTKDRTNRILRLGQVGYIKKFITKYGIWECKGTPTLIGNERY